MQFWTGKGNSSDLSVQFGTGKDNSSDLSVQFWTGKNNCIFGSFCAVLDRKGTLTDLSVWRYTEATLQIFKNSQSTILYEIINKKHTCIIFCYPKPTTCRGSLMEVLPGCAEEVWWKFACFRGVRELPKSADSDDFGKPRFAEIGRITAHPFCPQVCRFRQINNLRNLSKRVD